MKLLVTGGAGFIGSRIATQLIAQGHSVCVFDNLSTGRAAAIPEGATFFNGDMRDAPALKTAVAGQDAVIHLAAQALVTESITDPAKAFDINLLGGQNLLEAMHQAGVKRLVHSSTAAVYGNPANVPIAEDDLKMPINPYGATKYAFEQLLHAYHSSYGFEVVIFRYFNPYGPTEHHSPETHAIPNFIRATLTSQPIPLYWKGKQIRDFFFVDDIARAHVMALEKKGFHIFNLGSGRVTTVIEIVQKIFEITGKSSPIEDLGERAGDPPRLLADITKVEKELGWKPEISLQDGLTRTIAAFKERT